MRYKNEGDERRVWPGISWPDNTTLELDPGEEVEIDLPDGFEDTFLKPMNPDTIKAEYTVIRQDNSMEESV